MVRCMMWLRVSGLGFRGLPKGEFHNLVSGLDLRSPCQGKVWTVPFEFCCTRLQTKPAAPGEAPSAFGDVGALGCMNLSHPTEPGFRI